MPIPISHFSPPPPPPNVVSKPYQRPTIRDDEPYWYNAIFIWLKSEWFFPLVVKPIEFSPPALPKASLDFLLSPPGGNSSVAGQRRASQWVGWPSRRCSGGLHRVAFFIQAMLHHFRVHFPSVTIAVEVNVKWRIFVHTEATVRQWQAAGVPPGMEPGVGQWEAGLRWREVVWKFDIEDGLAGAYSCWQAVQITVCAHDTNNLVLLVSFYTLHRMIRPWPGWVVSIRAGQTKERRGLVAQLETTTDTPNGEIRKSQAVLGKMYVHHTREVFPKILADGGAPTWLEKRQTSRS